MLKSNFLDSLSNTLPDDRPITSIQLLELVDKCPRGFVAISKTYDQDQDADLWREGSSFLKKKSARYLCTSKTEGLPDYVVQELKVINDKELPPFGYSLINKTTDTNQKAWRKKQLCYKLAKRRFVLGAITDIVVCKSKPPEGFALAGDINGVLIYYKMGNVQDTQNGNSAAGTPVRPARAGDINYPLLDGDYEILSPPPTGGSTNGSTGVGGGVAPRHQPMRPAPLPPVGTPHSPPSHHPSTTGTLSTAAHFGLEGVPFVLNPKFTFSASSQLQIPRIPLKTNQQIWSEYNYPFTVERQT